MNERDLIEIIKKEIEKYYSNFDGKNEKDHRKVIGFSGKDMILKNELEERFSVVEEANEMVISELDIKELFEISQGTYSTDRGKNLLHNILEGKKMILVQEGIEWRKYSSIPAKLQEKYREYEKGLETYGVKILKRIEIKQYLEGGKNYYSGKVLDLRSLRNSMKAEKGYIEISANTVVTDLAKEYATTNHIKVIKR